MNESLISKDTLLPSRWETETKICYQLTNNFIRVQFFYPEDITKVTFRALAVSHSKWPTVETYTARFSYFKGCMFVAVSVQQTGQGFNTKKSR